MSVVCPSIALATSDAGAAVVPSHHVQTTQHTWKSHKFGHLEGLSDFRTKMDIIDLPHDLFLLIIAHLSARATVRCRRVSRRWRAAFIDQGLCLQLLKWHFPRCREMRLAYASTNANVVVDGDHGPDNRLPSSSETGLGVLEDWTSTFTTVASRYHHLCTATPRSIDKIRIGTTTGSWNDGGSFFGVGTWDRYLRLDDKEAPFHYPDPSWCYSQDDGVLVYHVHPDDIVREEDRVRAYYYPWRLLDLATGRSTEIPFPHDPNERIVRRVRIQERVLVLEWCERQAYHQLNDREECHRHVVTAFDVVRTASEATQACSWTITERAEWKLHFLGFPLNQSDRFLSAHTATHYAVYVWQPNRSPWGEDDPIESVIVWDISSPSYSSGSSTPPPPSPRIIRRMTWSTLAFYGIRQRSTPKLRNLALDEHNLYFVEEEHCWTQGAHSSLSPPRGHLVRCTGVPVIPPPPVVAAAAAFVLVPGNGMDARYDEKEKDEEEEAIVQGPRWLDQCGADGDANLSFCTRLNLPPTTTSSSSSSSSSCVAGLTRSPGIWNYHYHYPLAFSSSAEATDPQSLPVGKAVLAQEREAAARVSTTRWPGWAPCWRHEEFPYLTGMCYHLLLVDSPPPSLPCLIIPS